jgi:selenide, water dikinase
MEEVRLTKFAHGAGCGCKIAPAVLEEMLASGKGFSSDRKILVGNSSNDDAAVYDLGNGQALIITADFFTPIVDDAFTFGKVAAANAISDVYAMGGKPITAIALLGWPVEKIPASLAAKVLEGAREVCALAGIIISGGHTIDAPEPFFGLSVNGLALIDHIKRNNTAKAGDRIFLTKPVGVGIMATAAKRDLLEEEHLPLFIEQLCALNSFGELLGKEKGVTAMTDVTGFGLLGHLVEMAEGAGLSASIRYKDIPVLDAARQYALHGIIPDATYRNWNAYSNKVSIAAEVNAMESFALLPDPQTNGGLLIAVDPKETGTIKSLAGKEKVMLVEIGSFKAKDSTTVSVG